MHARKTMKARRMATIKAHQGSCEWPVSARRRTSEGAC